MFGEEEEEDCFAMEEKEWRGTTASNEMARPFSLAYQLRRESDFFFSGFQAVLHCAHGSGDSGWRDVWRALLGVDKVV